MLVLYSTRKYPTVQYSYEVQYEYLRVPPCECATNRTRTVLVQYEYSTSTVQYSTAQYEYLRTVRVPWQTQDGREVLYKYCTALMNGRERGVHTPC